MNAIITDVRSNVKISQGETLGNRKDAVIRSFVPVMERELELA